MNRKKILAMLSAILAAVLTFTISCFVLVSGASETAEVSDFFRNQLGTNGELIYDSLGTAHPGSGEITVALKEPIFFNSVTLQPTQEEMSNAKYELYCQVQGAFDALLADQPEMFWMDPGKIKYSYKYVGRIINMIPTWAINEVIISYGPNDDVAGHENEALSELRTAALSVSFSGSIYERAEKIYEYLRKNVTYTEDISNSIWQTAYGALVNGKASSKGFAHAFAYLCRYNGIDAVCVNGYNVNKGIRVWNYIIADDGMWYAVDTCGGNEEFTLFGTETKINGKSTFSEIYFPSGDFSGTQMNFFSYPKLAVQEYPKPVHPETTAPSPETTAPSPETTAPSPETTAPSPETTAPSPETTAPSPETTAPKPETTAPIPETTAPKPETTAPKPETTAPKPETTAPKPETTAPKPETTAPKPETTAPKPETTAPKPETTAPKPETTAPKPETTAPSPETSFQTEDITDTEREPDDISSSDNYDPESGNSGGKRPSPTTLSVLRVMISGAITVLLAIITAVYTVVLIKKDKRK